MDNTLTEVTGRKHSDPSYTSYEFDVMERGQPKISGYASNFNRTTLMTNDWFDLSLRSDDRASAGLPVPALKKILAVLDGAKQSSQSKTYETMDITSHRNHDGSHNFGVVQGYRYTAVAYTRPGNDSRLYIREYGAGEVDLPVASLKKIVAFMDENEQQPQPKLVQSRALNTHHL